MIQEILLFNDVPLFCINTGDGQGKENLVVIHTTRFNLQNNLQFFSHSVFVCLVCELISQQAVMICPLSTD